MFPSISNPKLLIGYDGSPCSDAALKDLKRAGLPKRVEAVVVTVAEVFAPPEDELPPEEQVSPVAAALVARSQADAKRAVEHALSVAQQGADRVKADFPDWTVTAMAEGGSPAWALFETAAHHHADLIVIGSHGHSSARGRLILGSVSLRVLYEAHCSVRIARCLEKQRAGPARIVVGFNGAKDSEVAIDAVAGRSWPEDSEVLVITVRAPLNHEKHTTLEKLLAAGLKVSEVSRPGDPVHVLVTEAVEWEADSIFVGTRDLHGFRHLLQGSVSTAVAATAQCSVEVVRAVRAAASTRAG